MLEQCPLTDAERSEEVLKILQDKIGTILDNYFENSPFLVAQEQHYKDHLFAEEMQEHIEEWKENHAFTSRVRKDMGTVRTSFLSKVGGILALLIAGGIGWKFLVKYLFTGE